MLKLKIIVKAINFSIISYFIYGYSEAIHGLTVETRLLFWLLLAVLALIPAGIARKKDRNFYAWYYYGLGLIPIAFIHSLLIRAKNKIPMRQCPYCAEFVSTEFVICSHCYKDLPEICENCGAKLDQTLRFCPNCHKSSPFF